MTEENKKNKDIFLNVCDLVWDFDEESLNYISKRISDDWEPVEEFKLLLKIPNSKYEDQRIRVDIDLRDPKALTFFERSDESYAIFIEYFEAALWYLSNKYNCKITYADFINNKVTFKKNQTKIKKVLEYIYAEENDAFVKDSQTTYDKETCAKWIVKKFERLGATKKSAKKLQFVISFNPIDWLMSSTSETWSSCFNINNENGGYQYCLGLPFLCGDKNRMLLYITDGFKKECMGIKVDRFQTRTWCILGDNNEFNIVKWYPNDTVGVDPVRSITGISNFNDRENFRRSKYPIDVISTKKGAVIGVYSDMGALDVVNDKLYIVGNGKDGQQFFTKNLLNCNKYNYSSFKLSNINTNGLGFNSPGWNIPKWKKLGLHVDMLFKTCKCSSCHEDKAGFVINNESFLCYDCTKDKTFVCDCCGNKTIITDNNCHEVINSDDEKIKICSSCFGRKENFCSCCGKFSNSTYQTKDKTTICQNCLDKNINGYASCSSCNTIEKNVYVYYNTYTKDRMQLCDTCKSNENNVNVYSTFGKYYTILKRKVSGGAIE